jgi:dipeptidyl aminopeptidase/acylaminoacyl peptidase
MYKKINWKWVFSRTGLILLLSWLLGNTISAYLFVRALTHPGCAPVAPLPYEHVDIWLDVEGASIPAIYYPSQNGAAIIALGGLRSAQGNQLPPVAFLLDAGYGVVQVGSRACAKPARPVTLGAREIKEGEAALRYLQTQSNMDSTQIGLFGFSMGGVGAIRLAAQQPSIAAVVAEGGYYNLGNDFTEPRAWDGIFREVFLASAAGMYWMQTGVNPWMVSPIDDIEIIAPRPVLLIYGEHEAKSGRAQMQFAAANEPKTLWIVPDGTHGTNHAIAPIEYEARVLAFFADALKP